MIKNLLNRNVTPEHRKEYDSIVQPLNYEKHQPSPAIKFEDDVFAYLHGHSDELGIITGNRLLNTDVDGIIQLNDGTFVLVEAKYALSWRLCCIARIEMLTCRANKYPHVKNGLIIFDHFSDNWAAKKKKHKLVNGWSHFYIEENMLRKVSSITVDIAQLKKQGLYCPYDK